MDYVYFAIAVFGLGAITLLTRSAFLISPKAVTLPPSVQRALRYAPIAALAAIVAPELINIQAASFTTAALSPKLLGAIAGFLAFQWSKNIGVTIVVGMLAFTAVRML